MKEFGVKLVRGVTLTSEVTKNDENYYSVKVEIDPVQYRDDQSLLVKSRSKFLEDIYSHDFQLIVKLKEIRDHSEGLSTIERLRGL